MDKEYKLRNPYNEVEETVVKLPKWVINQLHNLHNFYGSIQGVDTDAVYITSFDNFVRYFITTSLCETLQKINNFKEN